MTQDELKLALEALMRSRKAVSGNLDLAGCAYGKNDLDGHQYSDAKKALVTLDKALAAIKEALAQPPQQEPVADSAFLERVLAAMENVIDVADRKTSEFDALRGCIVDLTLMLHLPRPAPVQQEPEQPPQRKLLTDEKICLIAHNTDPNDWDDLTFKKCWHEGFKAGFREAEIEHNIKG